MMDALRTVGWQPTLIRLLKLSAGLLLAKVLLSILVEYAGYFPADFDSIFLTGREPIFHGAYRAAFYIHIVCGPVTLVMAALLSLGPGTKRFRHVHRIAGRCLVLITLLGLLPSGWILATHALAGPIASWGFMTLSIATAASVVMTAVQAIRHNIASHRRWATRSLLLLLSPLLLRIFSGIATTLDIDSSLFYQANAWVSWLLPCLIYEATLIRARLASRTTSLRYHLVTSGS